MGVKGLGLEVIRIFQTQTPHICMGSLLLEDTTQFHMSEFESVLVSNVLTNHWFTRVKSRDASASEKIKCIGCSSSIHGSVGFETA